VIAGKRLLPAAVVLALWGGGSVRGAQAPDAVARARQVLEAAAQAYRRVPALADTFTYVVRTPTGALPPKTLEIRLGAGHDVAVKDPLFEAIAVGETLYLVKSDTPGKYVARPYSGDFGKALDAIVGEQGSLFEPLQVAMRNGKGLEGWLNGLRFKILGPLRISGHARKSDDRGRAVDAISFTADNGKVEADFDAETHLLLHMSIRALPPGAPEGVFIEASGDFSPRVLASAQGLIAFDPRGKTAVAEVTSLDAVQLATGKPAPALEVERLGGGKVALAGLQGSVVVLDFWATWCAPCWKTLREAQRLADWAPHSGLKVAVFGVDTLEEFPTPDEKRAHAAKFFQSQGFTMPCLLDLDNRVFAGFGTPGLPSMVVIAPDGTIFKYHQGFFPKMLETLEKEVKEAASLPSLH